MLYTLITHASGLQGMSQISRKLIFVLLFLLPFTVQAKNGQVHEYQLPNGLKVLVKEDHRSPVAIAEVWYKVGSSYELPGTTGISHALEHMMFRGSKQYGAGELAKIVAENGGEQNAFTSYDFTAYYQMLDSSKLPLSFSIESDRMRNLLLRPEDFAKEIQVVMEERRMRVDDSPPSRAYERFMAEAFITNPYRHPTVGWMNDLQHMTDQDLRKWYEQWYAPNNAIVVVVGDVNPQQVYQLAEKYFGPLKPSVMPQIKPISDEKPLGERRVIVKVPAQVPLLLMGYSVPVLKTTTESWKPYALMVLSGILSAGDSSRLATNLVRGQQISVSANADYSLYGRLSTLFTFSAVPTPGYPIKQLENALLEQIKQLQLTQVSSEELARVKAQVIAGKMYQKDSIKNQAMEIGALSAVGLSWQLSENYVKQIEAITPLQVQSVAREYLIPERLTVAILEPLPLPHRIPPQMHPNVNGDQQHGR